MKSRPRHGGNLHPRLGVSWPFQRHVLYVSPAEYEFQFLATNNVGNSPRSVIVRATTQATPPPPPPDVADAALLVDWDNDGNYANADADVWPRALEGTFRCKRGRNYGSQRTGRSIAGRLEVRLDNRDGQFNALDGSSPLFGLLDAGKRVRYQVADDNGVLQTQWTGWLDDIPQTEVVSGMDTIRLRALGTFTRLDGRVTVAHRTSVTTETAGRRIFDPENVVTAAGAVVDGIDYLPAAIQGKRTMARWWVADLDRLRALRELEQTEGGFLWERKDGRPALDPFDARSALAARVVQATFTDDEPLAGETPVLSMKPDQPLRDLANSITTELRRFGAGTAGVLWSTTDMVIPANETVILSVRYPNPGSSRRDIGVQSWTN